ncbi:hypothetical protein GUITHDRAFT_135910 [Guillardia theta CCMP2712]|uniref:Uncharacterized protein n=1 Tax=Guillardia theta (strain CCMP2712) TaxID=905079 RepID=L1JNI4_GUITC|nr:hypothetical protein GUITHDRAFT_135910 [Guillardia theta CCMP2712]EKX49750.1 hypothetical protein GUITHDRAFT_135910 [Guillardia theta CCMP2712]|eukprot:XP_005836730.1 hypothetical protein GUITHDRAFT_135910 [Guillardia theta CCMP2712]
MMEEMEEGEDGKMGDMSGSPLVRSLRARLERAEDQVRRAREREKALRERLEGDDISHLLAAQRSQAELLSDQLKEAHRVADEAHDKYRQLLKEHGECQEKLMEKEQENSKLQMSLNEAKKQLESVSELEKKESDMKKQREIENLSQEIEMQQMDILALQRQLAESATEDAGPRTTAKRFGRLNEPFKALRAKLNEVEQWASKSMHYKQELELKDKELTEIKREMQDKTLDYESMKGRLENAHADLQECRERIAELLESHEKEIEEKAEEFEQMLTKVHKSSMLLEQNSIGKIDRLQKQKQELLKNLTKTNFALEGKQKLEQLSNKDVSAQIKYQLTMQYITFSPYFNRFFKSRLIEMEQTSQVDKDKLEDFDHYASDLNIGLIRVEEMVIMCENRLKEVIRKLKDQDDFLDPVNIDFAPVSEAESRDVESYKRRVEELEEKLQLLRSNSVPIEEYKQLSEGVLNECASVQKNAMQNISERFRKQGDVIANLEREKRILGCCLLSCLTQKTGELSQSLQTANSNLSHFRSSLAYYKSTLQQAQKEYARQKSELMATVSNLQNRLKQTQKELEDAQDHINKRTQSTEQSLRDLQLQLNDARNGKALVEAELHSAEQDIIKLKSVIKYATDAVRKAAEQRSELTAMINEGEVEKEKFEEMNAKLAEIEQDRSEIFQKLSESIYREHQALRQLDEVKHREGIALEELERLRNEVKESKSSGDSQHLQIQEKAQEMNLLRMNTAPLARSITEEVRSIREDLQKSAALWTLPNERLLEERARYRDQIIRLEGQISEHTRQMLQVTQDYEERLRRAEGQRVRRSWAQTQEASKAEVNSVKPEKPKSTPKERKERKVEGKVSPQRMRAAMSPLRSPKPVKSDSDSDSDESRLARRMKRVSAAHKAEATRREQVRQAVDEESNDEDDYVRSSRVRFSRDGTPAKAVEERGGQVKEEKVNGRPSLGSSFLAAMEIEQRMFGR